MRHHPDHALPIPTLTPERRLADLAEVLARGVRRHLAIAAQSAALSAGRSSEILRFSSPSALELSADKSVNVHAG